MKKLIYIPTMLILVALFGCGDDDEGSLNTSGQLSFEGEAATLTHAYIEDYGENDNGSFDVDITLTSKAVDFTSESVNNLSFVYLDLNTSIQNKLEAGTYTYSEERSEFKMVDGIVGVNASTDSEGNLTQGTMFDVYGGTVRVSVQSDVYTISFSLSDDTDKEVSGTFTGTLTTITTD